MSDKINKCLDDLRYAYKYKVPLEKVLNSYNFYADPQCVSKETYRNFCLFVYKTDIDDEGISKKLKKYPDYETYIRGKSSFTKFFIERAPIMDEPKNKQVKKYTTYSAHGHFQTNNPISYSLNHVAMLPAYILMTAIGGIAKISVSFFDLFKSDKNK